MMQLLPLRVITALMTLSLACVCHGAERDFTIANSKISVTLDAADATFSVTDKRTGQTWRQKATDKFKVLDCKHVNGGLQVT